MSAWFRDDANPQLLMEAKQIAENFLERSGEIDDACSATGWRFQTAR